MKNLVKFDLTAESLEAGMQNLLKEGNMQIGGTEKKLPNLLKKLHCTIQKEGNMQDSMMFEKLLQM